MFLDLAFRVHGRASCDRRKNGKKEHYCFVRYKRRFVLWGVGNRLQWASFGSQADVIFDCPRNWPRSFSGRRVRVFFHLSHGLHSPKLTWKPI